MATEKQVNYIKDLISKLYPENMPWWAALERLPEKWQQHKRRVWVLGALGIDAMDEDADDIDCAQAIEMYTNRLAELDATNWNEISVKDASKVIGKLKSCKIVW